jgi:RNA polymerase sigma-70 factor (ECF subfamily)
MNELTPDIDKDREDLSWIKEFNKGNVDMFNQLVLKHKKLVFNVCFRFLGKYEDADDCAQETFVKVYKTLGKFRMESKFTTWLYSIAMNTCRNWVTSSAYRRNKKSQDISKTSDDKLGDNSFHPEKDMEQKRQRVSIQKCIDILPEDHRSVVCLRDIDGLTYGEITVIISQTLGTVKSRLARARKQLRKCLQGIL